MTSSFNHSPGRKHSICLSDEDSFVRGVGRCKWNVSIKKFWCLQPICGDLSQFWWSSIRMALTTIPKEQRHSTARLRVTSTLKRDATTSAKCIVQLQPVRRWLSKMKPVLFLSRQHTIVHSWKSLPNSDCKGLQNPNLIINLTWSNFSQCQQPTAPAPLPIPTLPPPLHFLDRIAHPLQVASPGNWEVWWLYRYSTIFKRGK